MPWGTNRKIEFTSDTKIGIVLGNRSTHYAKHWLELTGNPPSTKLSGCRILIVSGEIGGFAGSKYPRAEVVIRLWDYQVGYRGTGTHASAVSGAASTIGYPNGPGVALPNDIPEKWCGAYGVIIGLSEIWRRGSNSQQTFNYYDISAADIMRSFSLQNAGDKEEIFSRWRRNGRLCVEHGGIFPMGFYPCKDGYVALLGRSRRDWKNIRNAIGNPKWSQSEEFDDPFELAKDSSEADINLSETLSLFTRDDLLEQGLKYEAVIAPVYDQEEALGRKIFRKNFVESDIPQMPFFVEESSTSRIEKCNLEKRRKSKADAPLSGLRCIELCWIWSGPMVAQILGDLGAEIIKIESADRFDLYRTRGLETLRGKMEESTRIESSIYFNSLNRNKLGLGLNLKHQGQLEVLKRLCKSSDLIIENFTVGTMDRLGIGPKELSKLNPSLVQLSMSGPGRFSSLEQLRSYGLVLSALGGAEASITAENQFLGSPTFSISDPNAAVFATIGALAGAIRAQETGMGSIIDLSQIEAVSTLNSTPTQPQTKLETILQTKDGYYVAISLPKTAFTDERLLQEELSKLSKEFLVKKCRSLGGEICDLIELSESGDSVLFNECEGHVSVTHPYTGNQKIVAAPWRINGKRPIPHKAAPVLGENSSYVLRSILNLSDTQLTELAL